MGFGKKFHEALQDSVQAGIITPEQLCALEARQEQRGTGTRIKGITWLAVMAGLCFALGLVLIISHNWHEIPDAAKILSFLIILVAAGETALKLEPGKPAAATGAAALWFFLPIA